MGSATVISGFQNVVMQGIRCAINARLLTSLCGGSRAGLLLRLREMRARPPTPHVLRLVMGGPQTVCDEPGQKETGGSGAKNKGKGAAAARAEHKRAPRHHATPSCLSAPPHPLVRPCRSLHSIPNLSASPACLSTPVRADRAGVKRSSSHPLLLLLSNKS